VEGPGRCGRRCRLAGADPDGLQERRPRHGVRPAADDRALPRARAGRADSLSADWDDVRAQRFNLIFASLVLQHLETDTARARLADFARMAPATYLLTRRDGDFGADMLRLVKEADTLTAGECVEVDHDPATHKLRVVGRASLEEMLASGRGGHFELLLRPAT
jgi:hypothetical protein